MARRARRARRHPARHLVPPVAGPVPGPGRDLRGHPAGVRLLPRGVRHQVPVRQVRPAVRARVQGRRDGERRRGHAARGLRLPVAGHRLLPGGARRDDPARDGAHVVRRPGDHALVGRPVAERVVRHLGGHARAGRGHPVDPLVDHVRPGVQGVGLPAGPAALHPPDRRRHPRHRGGRGQLRRHHLRQGRFRAEAARRVRRPGELPGGRAALLRRALLGERDPGRPAVRPRGGLRARPRGLVAGMAGNGRGQHPAAVVHRRRRGTFHLVRGAAGGGRVPPGAALAPHRHRSLRPNGRWSYPPGHRRDRRVGRRHRGARAGRCGTARPGAGQRRRPDLRQDPARRALAADAGHLDRLVHLVAARGAVLGGGLGHVPGRRDGRAGLRPAGPRRRRLGAGHQRRADAAAAGRAGGAPVHRPRLAGLGARADGVVAALAARCRPRRGPTTSSPTRGRSPAWRPRRRTWS